MSPNDDVRIGTPERERAISLINDAFSAGYLEIAEFEERSGGVYAAKTRGELKQLVADLPSAAMLFPNDPSVHAAHPVVASAGAVPVTSFDIDWDTVRRKGSWQVPPKMLVTGSMGSLDLDLRTATFLAPVTELELQVSASTVKLHLAADHEVRIEVNRSGWSTVKDTAGSPRRPGGQVIVVRGSLSGMSGLKIKR